ncbi:hypothetical protein BJX65DRAFT_63318 [Aspergillus insuetus]
MSVSTASLELDEGLTIFKNLISTAIDMGKAGHVVLELATSHHLVHDSSNVEEILQVLYKGGYYAFQPKARQEISKMRDKLQNALGDGCWDLFNSASHEVWVAHTRLTGDFTKAVPRAWEKNAAAGVAEEFQSCGERGRGNGGQVGEENIAATPVGGQIS